MRTLLVVKLILIATLLLSACVTSPAPATPTAAPIPSPQVAATVPNPSPVAVTAAAVTLAAPKDYPPRPTATLYATPESAPGMYTNSDLGISLRYPNGWDLTPPDPGSDILTWIDSPNRDVFAAVFANPLQAGQTLQTAAAQIRDGTLTGLKGMKIVSDQANKLDDGRDAWTTIATGTRDDGTQLKINITTALNGARAYSLLIFGAPTGYDDNTSDIGQLIGALSLNQPLLFGLGRDQALVLAGGESKNPREYDPATTHGSGDKLAFSGLVSFDPKLNLVPDLAGTWDVKDGSVYTFHLRPDARFHNGKPVTTQDVIYSWERAADPKTKSDTVLTYLGDIVGVKEMNAGQADHIAGLKAIDEHTLQVTIDAPKPYFLLKLTYPTAFVVDRQNVESGPDWYRTPNGTGPYRLARWDSFKLILYERNDDYYLKPPAIPYVIIQLFTGDPLRLYESGDVDMAGIGSSNLPRFKDPKEPLHTDLIDGVSLCTGMILFDVNQPPFDDPKIRQAFSLAFNRSQYIDVVLHDDALPALGPLPPGLPGFNTDLKGLPYDPAKARQLLAESKYGSVDKLPPIVYTDSGNGSDVGGGVAALAQMWQQNLGVTITVENVEPDKYSDLMHAGHHGQIFEGGWCADYPDPENFTDVLFHTGAQQNQTHYSSSPFDALVEQARVEQNTTKRLQLYQQAEQMIVDDAPAIFTIHSLSHVLVKPYIKGYVLTPIDIPLERYLSIDATQLK